jgi:hypothetical protein
MHVLYHARRVWKMHATTLPTGMGDSQVGLQDNSYEYMSIFAACQAHTSVTFCPQTLCNASSQYDGSTFAYPLRASFYNIEASEVHLQVGCRVRKGQLVYFRVHFVFESFNILLIIDYHLGWSSGEGTGCGYERLPMRLREAVSKMLVLDSSNLQTFSGLLACAGHF